MVCVVCVLITILVWSPRTLSCCCTVCVQDLLERERSYVAARDAEQQQRLEMRRRKLRLLQGGGEEEEEEQEQGAGEEEGFLGRVSRCCKEEEEEQEQGAGEEERGRVCARCVM